jgi:hypothetical protein
MTGDDLIADFRIVSQDNADPPLWADEAVLLWLDEGQQEAAIRARLLHESSDAAVCNIAVTATTAVYALHAALYEIDHIAFLAAGATTRTPLKLVSREELDRIRPDWRDKTGIPEFAIQTDKQLRLTPTPDAAGSVLLEGYRLPLVALDDGSKTPEINAAHHRHLVHWALHRAYGIQDADTFDKDRSDKAEKQFTDYFGPRPDADLRRSTRTDEVQHNQAFWV